MDTLTLIRDSVWLYVAGPALVAAVLWLTIRLAAPQIIQLPRAFRGLWNRDPGAPGWISPALATILSAATSYGSAAMLGAATAIALGGAGTVAWAWLFAFLFAPLRYGETFLARTAPPGASESSGSLVHRLLADDSRAVKALGAVLFASLAIAAFAFLGGTHAVAAQDLAHAITPSLPAYLLGGAAVCAAILIVASEARAAAIAAWLGVIGFLLVTGIALWAAMSEPGRAFGLFTRAINEAFEGAPRATPFAGALAGEVSMAAILFLLPPVAASSGIEGANHSPARARTTRNQAATAMLAPLIFAIATTVVGMAVVGTGAFFAAVESERPLTEVTVYRGGFDSARERRDETRLYDGHVRISEGQLRGRGVGFATERGMIRDLAFTYRGEPADVAIRYENGRAIDLRIPAEGQGGNVVLESADLEQLQLIMAEGTMLPQSGALLAHAVREGTGSTIAARLLLASLIALLTAAAAGWGFGLARSLPRSAKSGVRIAVGLIPAIGIGGSALAGGAAGWLTPFGQIAAGITSTLVAVALIVRSNELRKLHRSTN